MERKTFGLVGNEKTYIYTLKNKNGLVTKITDYGGIVTEVHIPDRKNQFRDIVLGFDALEGYLSGHPYFGAIVGRVANRIALGKFTINGKNHRLAVNNGPNHLHGGIKGFDKHVWKSEPFENDEGPALRLTHISPDGDEGFPGTLEAEVIYTLTHADELKIEMTARTDKTTVVNMAHHSYWNLGGHDSRDVLDHEIHINARRYTPTDETLIPTGEIRRVENSPYDFLTPKRIGASLGDIPSHPEANDPGGYDTNFVLEGSAGELKLAARVREPESGRAMEVYTTEPGVQFYTGNFLDGTLRGKGGIAYQQRHAFCLETQHFPDSIHRPDWPTTLLEPGETYHHLMVHRFFAD
ncbi:MAG: aldose epimerase family protein [Planctomycetota bacterium]